MLARPEELAVPEASEVLARMAPQVQSEAQAALVVPGEPEAQLMPED